jgi:hypothetical protein
MVVSVAPPGVAGGQVLGSQSTQRESVTIDTTPDKADAFDQLYYNKMAIVVMVLTVWVAFITTIAIGGGIAVFRSHGRKIDKTIRRTDERLDEMDTHIKIDLKRELAVTLAEMSEKSKKKIIKEARQYIESGLSGSVSQKSEYYFKTIARLFGLISSAVAAYSKDLAGARAPNSSGGDGDIAGEGGASPLILMADLYRLMSNQPEDRIDALNMINIKWINVEAFPRAIMPTVLRDLREAGYLTGASMDAVAAEICRKCGEEYWDKSP